MIEDPLPHADDVIYALEQLASHGIPGKGTGIVDIGTAPFLAHFEREVLDDLVLRGGATCRIFEGPYGAGKTHLLDRLRAVAIKKGMAVAKTDLSQDLGLDDWRPLTQHVLQNLELAIDGELVRSVPTILETWGRKGLGTPEQLRGRKLPHVGFRNAMCRALSGNLLPVRTWDVLRRFLVGERLRAADLKAADLADVHSPISKRNAEHVLNTVLAGLFTLGVPGTMLLFDEHEKSFVFHRYFPPKRVQVAANVMRRLIDGCTTGGVQATVAVFAVLPGFLANCALAYEALGQRVQAPPDDGRPTSWRWPVMQVDGLAHGGDADRFVSEAADTFDRLAAHCGVSNPLLREELKAAASDVVQRDAGAGFRRQLMKRLATLALRAIENTNGAVPEGGHT